MTFGIILDVEATRAIRQAEAGAAKTMIERTEERFGLKPERLVGDTAYGAASCTTCSGYVRRLAFELRKERQDRRINAGR